MEGQNTTWPPPVPWKSGWSFDASAWSDPATRSAMFSFTALEGIATIGPADASAGWSLHLGPTGTFDGCQVRLFANGFHIRCERATQTFEATLFVVDAGVLIGRTTFPTAPTLFSAEHEVTEGSSSFSLETPHGRAVLARAETVGGLRFALAASTDPHEAVAQVVEDHLQKDADAFLAREIVRRTPFWQRHADVGPRAEMVSLALETLIGHLRPPLGPFPARWSAERVAGQDVLLVSELYPLVQAWCEIDYVVAQDLILAALSRQQSEGALPARCRLDGSTTRDTACLPLLAQAALRVWDVGRDPDFLAAVTRPLHRYLTWMIRHYDPMKLGTHHWQSPEEALVQESFGLHVMSPDLAAMLLCEIDAVIELSRSLESGAPDPTWFHSQRREFAEALDANFWDERAALFRPRKIDGPLVDRLTFSSLVPLLWSGLEPDRRNGLLRALKSHEAFQAPEGVPSAVAEQRPSVQAMHQFLLLEALQRNRASQELQGLTAKLSKALLAHYGTGHGLPAELSHDEAEDGAAVQRRRPENATIAAALIIKLQAIRDKTALGTSRAQLLLRALDDRRTTVMAVAALLIALVVVAGTIYAARKKTFTASSAEALVGLADGHYSAGRYDEAIRGYEQLLGGGHQATVLQLRLANAHFRKGNLETAEKLYRELMERDHGDPKLLSNLALTLFRQGKYDEAAQYYQRVIDEYGDSYPRIGARARFSLSLIRERTGEMASRRPGERENP